MLQYLFWNRVKILPALYFEPDNSSLQSEKETKKWLEDNKIPTFDLSANSPDLNPIKNVWNVILYNIYRKMYKLSSITQKKN